MINKNGVNVSGYLTDAVATAVNSTTSVIGYIKGFITSWGFVSHTTPSATYTSSNASFLSLFRGFWRDSIISKGSGASDSNTTRVVLSTDTNLNIGSVNSVPLNGNFSIDAAYRNRVSLLTMLYGGKTTYSDNTDLWAPAKGTGTRTFSVADNWYNLSVNSGQVLAHQSTYCCPYFEGKSQLIEVTSINFGLTSGTTKRKGYFSNTGTPFNDTTTDGFFIENDGSNYYLVIYRAGTLIARIIWTSWNNYSLISSYDWNKFTVCIFDFLWLGGTALRFFMVVPGHGLTLIHTYEHAGTSNGTTTIMKSPNQPIRYEIKATTQTSSLIAICSAIYSEGSFENLGFNRYVWTDLPSGVITCANAGAMYLLKGFKRDPSKPNLVVRFTEISGITTSTSRAGYLILLKKPTYTGGTLTYSSKFGILHANGNGTIIVTEGTGEEIAMVPVSIQSNNVDITSSALSWVTADIDGNGDEYILAFMCLVANTTISASIGFQTFN